MEKILTVEDVAALLQVKPITVREMFRENRLRAFKMGKAWRTTETMLREDIEQLAQGPRPVAPETAPAGAVSTEGPAAVAPAPPKAPKKQAPKVESPAPAVEVPSPPPEETTPEVETVDDTQQLLF